MQIFILILLVFVLAIAPFAQLPPALTVSEVVNRASTRRLVYVDEFKNLISQETKSFEIYDKKGAIRKRRTVDSTFLVYQLSRDEKRIAEFRNVISVDGKPLSSVDKRAASLFESISRSESSKKELEKLQNESLRFDEELFITDLTLFQAVALAENMRPYFEFRLAGKESIDGVEVYVLSYRQVKKSPYIFMDPKMQPTDGSLSVYFDVGRKFNGDAGERLSGTFWIDASTFQVRRELRALTLKPDGVSTPVKFAETTFEYQNSDFGILTPQKITHAQYRIDPDKRTSSKEAVVAFVYDKFTKPDVEVRSSDVKH